MVTIGQFKVQGNVTVAAPGGQTAFYQGIPVSLVGTSTTRPWWKRDPRQHRQAGGNVLMSTFNEQSPLSR
ncbi:MAG: hypothetical protein U0794_22270 [Isosphaeraceae bacterium]